MRQDLDQNTNPAKYHAWLFLIEMRTKSIEFILDPETRREDEPEKKIIERVKEQFKQSCDTWELSDDEFKKTAKEQIGSVIPGWDNLTKIDHWIGPIAKICSKPFSVEIINHTIKFIKASWPFVIKSTDIPANLNMESVIYNKKELIKIISELEGKKSSFLTPTSAGP